MAVTIPIATLNNSIWTVVPVPDVDITARTKARITIEISEGNNIDNKLLLGFWGGSVGGIISTGVLSNWYNNLELLLYSVYLILVSLFGLNASPTQETSISPLGLYVPVSSKISFVEVIKPKSHIGFSVSDVLNVYLCPNLYLSVKTLLSYDARVMFLK